MPYTLAQLAELLDAPVSGDGQMLVHGAAVVEDARPGEITLIDKAENLKRLASCAASAVVLPADAPEISLPSLRVKSVHAAFGKLITLFRPARVAARVGVSPLAMVSPTAKLGENVDIHAHAVIGDDVEIGANVSIHPGVHIMAGCRIAADATIYSNAVLYEGTIVGPRATIHAAVVLGCHGFGYAFVNGRHERAAQQGWVQIEADVEIGAGSTIDRGSYGPTIVGEGSKLDDQVMIGHNCRIGKHNLICSQVGIAGSTTTGDYVVMAGQVGVRDHLHIGHRAVLAAKAGISNDVPDGATYLGCPATPLREQRLMMASYSKLPEMRRELRLLSRQLEKLEAKLAGESDADADASSDGDETKSSAA